jgi:hypothetical protein
MEHEHEHGNVSMEAWNMDMSMEHMGLWNMNMSGMSYGNIWNMSMV